MKIVYLTAGAAGMYCGACLHDNTLAAALRGAGEDLLLVPLYTPIRTDEPDVSYHRVFFGGINVALQQKLSVFRHTPRWLDRLLDRPGLLAWLGKLQQSTSPRLLGEMTCSMLKGEEGRQRKELDKLTDWLVERVGPDIIHLPNTLLSGLARQLRARLDVPLVCNLAGEDLFVEQLVEPLRGEARELLRARCQDLDALIAMNQFYADFMSEYLEFPRSRIHVIPYGLNLSGFGPSPYRSDPQAPFVIGTLARICPDKGLDLLAEAFVRLCRQTNLPPLTLKAAGYLAAWDRGYLRSIQRKLDERGLGDRFSYVGQVDRPGKIAFLQSLNAFCLPTPHPESKGLPVLEALASGVPVVVPDHGSFPEIVTQTGGGILFPAGDPNSLAEAIERLVRQPPLAAKLGRAGRAVTVADYGAQQMAARTQSLYQTLLED
jgi:glycosyltransferase involved in cell wall biosynthesis